MTEWGHWEVLGDHVCSIWTFYLILTLSLHFLFDSHHDRALGTTPAICMLGAWSLLRIAFLCEKDILYWLGTGDVDPASPKYPDLSLMVVLCLSAFDQIEGTFIRYRFRHFSLFKTWVLLVWVMSVKITIISWFKLGSGADTATRKVYFICALETLSQCSFG